MLIFPRPHVSSACKGNRWRHKEFPPNLTTRSCNECFLMNCDCIPFTIKVRDGRLRAEPRIPDELHDVGVPLRRHSQGGTRRYSGTAIHLLGGASACRMIFFGSLALTVRVLAGWLECVGSHRSKHRKTLPTSRCAVQ